MAVSMHKRDVSCLGLTFIYDYMAQRGIPRRRLQEGLPYPPEHLENRLNWIDIGTMCEIERRLEALFPGEPDIHLKIGRTLGKTSGFGFARVLIRAVTSPFQAYGQLPMIINRFLFPFCHPSFERAGTNRIRAIYRFDEGYAPTDAFLQTVQGILMSVPTLMGAPEASVTLTRRSPLEAHFDIRLYEWLGPRESVKGIIQGILGVARMRFRNLPDAAVELEDTNQLLLEKVEALTDAQGQLNRKVRDLSVLNALARAAASELDLPRLLASAVNVISDQLGETPTAVFMRSGETPSWIPEAHIRVGAADLKALARAVHGWLPADQAAAPRGAEARSSTVLGWTVVPMASKDHVVGVLALATGERTDYEPQLLESVADELAVAVDNAVSYRVIRDLRDNLDLRVRERTAELEEARGKLEDTIARLERSDRARSEFFTNVSHELKTPLTLILAPVDELETRMKGAGYDEALPTLDTIRNNAQSLLRLVNEILDFARLDEGNVAVRPEDLDLSRFVSDVVTYLKPLADRRGVTLACERPPRKVAARMDPRLVRRALMNLVGNAIKYVDPGDHVTVRLKTARDQVVMEVEDTGPGIPPAEQQRIFERFQRASDARGRVVEGSGIGLAMVRDIARLHGGTVELDSEVGRGSTFRLRLPRSTGAAVPEKTSKDLSDTRSDLLETVVDAREAVPAPEAPKPAADGARETVKGRVLLVEDNAQMRQFLGTVLGRRYSVAAAVDGVDGLEKARRELPDVILSDVMMPRMDGFEMCRQLKAEAATRSIPLILITARHGTDAVLEGFNAGADDFLIKPFSTPELLARLDAQLRIRSLTLSLLRSEQQAALGIVSAGIAHEVLNPVNAIVNSVVPLRKVFARMKQGREGEDDAMMCDALLKAVEQSGERIHRIVEAFRTVARPGDERLNLQEQRPGELIDAVLAMLQFRLSDPDRVSVTRRSTFDDPILCYPALLGQVVMNLVGNALDALEAGGGHLWIGVDRVDDRVRISVRDDGPGIPSEVRERIFTPFFTTKAPGAGTGLGLSISREIMELHGGTLELASDHETGAEFVLTVPLASALDGERSSLRHALV